ncbi:MAG TPA: hypothetical protein DF712_23635 [Balneola sp.]|jgi:hypothetical protein|nr:hypothetical protein [Bacteroidota bacterium]HCI69319.1 hypothetical protein [Balneola sp.]HCT55449.1 hypothetical protein [Balneola sp.]|tara:strand:- start:8609 stop:9352 length:744 start_codon:yes stop_codon:yes gene_type:complete
MTSPSGQPSIEIFGVLIMEPVVTLTDLLVTSVCVYAYIKLRKLDHKGPSHQYFRLYFLIMAIATFFGGITGHAFQYALGLSWKLPGWLLSMLAVSALERGIISFLSPIVSGKTSRILGVANVIELSIFAALSFVTLNFFYVQVHSAYGLALIVFPLCFYAFWKTGNNGAKIICRSVIFTSLAAFFYTSKISISPWFNHLDISHSIMAIGTFLFYKGAVEMGEISKISYRKTEISKIQAFKALISFKT